MVAMAFSVYTRENMSSLKFMRPEVAHIQALQSEPTNDGSIIISVYTIAGLRVSEPLEAWDAGNPILCGREPHTVEMAALKP